MTVREEAEAVLRRYTFSGMLGELDIRLRVDANAHLTRTRPIRCVLYMKLPDARDPGRTFESESAFHIRLGEDAENHSRILDAVLDRLLHEVAECLDYDGTKPADPHGPSKKFWNAWYAQHVGD